MQFTPAGNDPLMPAGYWRNKHNHVFTTHADKQRQPVHRRGDQLPDPSTPASTTRTRAACSTGQRSAASSRWRDINVSANMQPSQVASALAKEQRAVHQYDQPQSSEGFSRGLGRHLQTHQALCQPERLWLDRRTARPSSSTTRSTRRPGNRHRLPRQARRPQLRAALAISSRGRTPCSWSTATCRWKPWWRQPSPRRWSSWSARTRWWCRSYSHLSGIGKTTAMMLAQAVWGHPRAGMSTLADTTNSMMKKIGDLKIAAGLLGRAAHQGPAGEGDRHRLPGDAGQGQGPPQQGHHRRPRRRPSPPCSSWRPTTASATPSIRRPSRPRPAACGCSRSRPCR